MWRGIRRLEQFALEQRSFSKCAGNIYPISRISEDTEKEDDYGLSFCFLEEGAISGTHDQPDMSPLSRSSQPANRAASVKPEPAAEPMSDDEESALQTLTTDSPAGDTPASGLHGHRAESSSETPSVPLQKRRRVTRACEYVIFGTNSSHFFSFCIYALHCSSGAIASSQTKHPTPRMLK